MARGAGLTRAPLAWACALLCALGAAPAAAQAEADLVHAYRVEPGDTLIGIGRRLLVDPAQWRELARINNVRQPRRMPTGLLLNIPLTLMRVSREPATLELVHGEAKGGDDVRLRSGQSVPEGAELRTGSDGDVAVRLVDGTLLRLRAASRLRIEQSQRLPDAGLVRSGVRLDRGRVEIEAAPAPGGKPGFRIGTPQGVLGVRGTRFRVAADDEATRGEVLEGRVEVSGRQAGSSRLLEPGFGTVVDRAGQVAEPRPLLAAPDLSAVPRRHERPLVRIEWPAVPGVARWRAEVSTDEGFERILVGQVIEGSALRLADLPDGSYQLRVRGLDSRGLEGRDARTRFTLKARPEPPLPRTPRPRAVLTGERVDFSWTAHDEARRYRLQIARRPDFTELLHDRADLTRPEASVGGLQPGTYHWRLATIRAGDDTGPWGDPQSFEIRAAMGAPAAPRVGDQGVGFSWPGNPDQRFDFQIARDAAFGDIVFEKRLDRTGIELAVPGSGRFYVRVRPIDPDGFVGPWTTPQSFEIPNCARDSRSACVRVGGEPLLLGW